MTVVLVANEILLIMVCTHDISHLILSYCVRIMNEPNWYWIQIKFTFWGKYCQKYTFCVPNVPRTDQSSAVSLLPYAWGWTHPRMRKDSFRLKSWELSNFHFVQKKNIKSTTGHLRSQPSEFMSILWVSRLRSPLKLLSICAALPLYRIHPPWPWKRRAGKKNSCILL